MNRSLLGCLVFPDTKGGPIAVCAERYTFLTEFVIWSGGWKIRRAYGWPRFELSVIKIGQL